VIIGERLAENAKEKERLFREQLALLQVKEVRGEGLLLAVVPPNKKIIPDLVARAPEYGLLLDYFLFCDEAFRIAPPLTISNAEIILACQRLGRLMDALS
jgi:putrescine aminotransferase